MELVKNKKMCCGCSMCYNICPKHAIKMIEDEYGFKYPEIDKNKCINCGLCKNMCAYQKDEKKLYIPQKAYAAVSANDNLIKKSASGGIFADLAKNILNAEGVVYGSTMEITNNGLEIKHIRVDREEDLIKLQGSKYVQSDISSIYSLIKEDLENNKVVLFSGTPCQVNSIRGYLKYKEYENLYFIDIICHGVPNNKMFKDYISLLEHKVKGKVIDFKFRYKAKNVELTAAAYISKKNKIIKKLIPAYNSSYYQLFLDSKIYRENCYDCPYAKGERIGDITIGDFWKVEIEHPEEIKDNNINTNKGISCILINTKSGEKLLEKYGNDINKFESSLNKIAKHNAQLTKPSQLDNERTKILNLYKQENYKSIDKYYKKKNYRKNLAKKIWYKVPLTIRKRLRK